MTIETIPSTIGTPLLNTRRENFCLALVAGSSQTNAVRLAGYRVKDAARFGNELLSFINVRERVAELQNAAVDATIMTLIEIKQKLSEIGRAKIQDYHNERGALDPFREGVLNPGAISEVQQEYDPTGLEAFPTKIKLHDPVKAMDTLIKMAGAYPAARMEVSGRDGGAIRIEDTREKLLGIIARLSVRIEEESHE